MGALSYIVDSTRRALASSVLTRMNYQYARPLTQRKIVTCRLRSTIQGRNSPGYVQAHSNDTIMNLELEKLLYVLFKDGRTTVSEVGRATLSPIAAAAAKTIGLQEDLSEALDGLARALIDHNMAEAAEVVCENLDWNVERCELQEE